MIFEGVDRVVEPVDDVEEAFGDLVDECVDAHARLGPGAQRGIAYVVELAGGVAGRGLADGQEHLEGGDEIDLLEHHAVGRHEGKRQNPEYVVSLRLHPRPGLVAGARLTSEPGPRDRVNLGGHRGAERLVVGIHEVDPLQVGHASNVTGSVRRQRCMHCGRRRTPDSRRRS